MAVPHLREPHAHISSPEYTSVHTCTLRPTGQRPSRPARSLRLLVPSCRAGPPGPCPGRILTWGARGRRRRRVRASGPRQRAERGRACASARLRLRGSVQLRAGPGPAQRAEGARQRSGGFAGFLMGRICSGLRFKKKFDLWNRRLGEFKLDATD